MSSINQQSSSEILVAHGILYDRKITRKQGKNKNVQNKLHKPQCGNAARIKLFWPQELSKSKEFSETIDEVPLCYKVNSEKEKLAMWHSENFRQQLSCKYPTRAPPLLAATNEYGIQKPVCSFIRPSASPYPELTEWRGIAKFVSDHLQLQPLNTPTQLIVDSEGAKANSVKYVVQSRKQFTSRYLNSVQAHEEKKIEELLEQKREEQRLRIKEEERLPPDPLHGRRVHCWVLLLPGRARSDVDKPFYLEPASGKAFDIQDVNHMAVESVWNHLNFWFNIHTSQPSISSFDLNDKNSWIPLLNDDEISRSLDMPSSWMEKINISREAYNTRYPDGCKTVLYKRSKLELFAELSRDDGLVTRITQYSDLEWSLPLQELYEYKHRQDLLQQTKLDLIQQRGTDFYDKGRMDHIKEHDYSLSEDDQERKIYFFNCSHPEGLSSLCVQPNCILETYKGHGDFLKERLMNFKLQDNKQFIVEETLENLQMSPGLPENNQVAKRKFFHLENKIFLTFHHAPDQISAGYLHFIKPSEEGKFGVEHVHEYEPLDMPHTKGQENEMKYLMEKQMKAEIKVLCHAGQIHNQIQNLLDNLRKDRDNPGLKTSVFDEERNHNMVHLMQLRERELLAQAMMELVDPADPLAPLLERDDGLGATCLTPSQLAALKQECEKDIKQSLKRVQNNIELEIIKLKAELEQCQNQSVIFADKELEETIGLKIQALEYRLKRLDPDKY